MYEELGVNKPFQLRKVKVPNFIISILRCDDIVDYYYSFKKIKILLW